MKILRMNLLAYGPFTETLLDLGGGDEGFHLIYGPNEAGKSSALRALRQMLYGIPERSQDNFIHPYTMLRIGATLRHSDGRELRFVRRKGRAHTLRSGDDKTLMEEADLERFLGGVSGDVFATMFGIDHADLVQGGRDILQGGGSLGQVLFAAGAGISTLRRVQTELQEEADGLFKPSGQKQRINEAISKLAKSQKELRDAQLPDQQWMMHDRALDSALKRKMEVEGGLEEKQRERRRLERIREALPLIARREELVNDLGSLGGAILLREDFGDRRRELITELRIAENDRIQADRNTEKIRGEVDTLEVPETLLENAEVIELLYRDLGSQQKAARDRNDLLTRRDVLWGEAKEILSGLRQDLSLEEAERLRLKRTDTVRIQDLGSRYERLVTKLEGAREEMAGLTPQIQALEKEIQDLDTPLEINHLRIVHTRALKQGAIEDRYESECEEIKVLQASLENLLKRQMIWSGTLVDLETLPIPALETIDAFEGRLGEAHRERAGFQNKIAELEERVLESEGHIEHLRLELDVPTEKDLEEARRKREKGWWVVRRAWEDGSEPSEEAADFLASFPSLTTLTEAYELSVQQADEVSDRLRREADRVAKMANLLAERETRKVQIEGLVSRLEAADTEEEKITKEWVDLWKALGISPRTPREMRAWAQDQKALAEQMARLRERKNRAEDLKTDTQAHRLELSESLSALGEPPVQEREPLSELIEKAGRLIEREEALKIRKEHLVREKILQGKKQEETRAQAKRLEEALSQWRDQWEQAVRPLGLDGHAVPAEANSVIEDLKSLFDKLKEAEILHKRINGIDRDTEAFRQKVIELAGRVPLELKGLPPERAASELHLGLNRARTDQSHRQSLEKQRGQEEERASRASEKIGELESELKMMCQEAGCKEYDELPEAERRSDRRRKVESELAEVEDRIRHLSAGTTIENFVAEAGGVDPDGIDMHIVRLTGEIEELEKERSKLDQTIGTEKGELGRMDGSARAADLAEEIQMVLGGLEAHVDHYIRIRLATTVLVQAIERYREKYQGPILKRANGLFVNLTLGSFEGIRVEYGDQGGPVLVGVRQGGREIVGVEGMSDGAADQLYLALRLASLENYLERNEPMPFIVDDILIRFDNERAMAALGVLAELSKKTQVIFFTHHRHLMELAEARIDSSVLFEHSLHT